MRNKCCQKNREFDPEGRQICSSINPQQAADVNPQCKPYESVNPQCKSNDESKTTRGPSFKKRYEQCHAVNYVVLYFHVSLLQARNVVYIVGCDEIPIGDNSKSNAMRTTFFDPNARAKADHKHRGRNQREDPI